MPAKIIQRNKKPFRKVKVDTVTIDIIESALRNARFEMDTVLFRTAEGTKLFTTVMNEKVLFEADDHTVAEGWSVIVRGTARMLTSAEEIREADQAVLMPWVPTEKLRYVRVTPSEISARRFRFGPEPQHGHVPG